MTDRTPTDDASAGQLVAQLTEDVATLVRDEVALAKRDLVTAGKRVGIGAGLFGVAGVVAWFGVGTLVAAAVLGLATALDAWLAALIVAAVLFVIAGISALVGKSSVQKAPEPPKARVESVKADVAAVRPGEAVHDRHRCVPVRDPLVKPADRRVQFRRCRRGRSGLVSFGIVVSNYFSGKTVPFG